MSYVQYTVQCTVHQDDMLWRQTSHYSMSPIYYNSFDSIASCSICEYYIPVHV